MVVVVSDKEHIVLFLVFSSTIHPHISIVKYYTPTTEDKGGWLVGDKQGVPWRLRPIRRSSGDTERTTGGAECPQLCLSTERACSMKTCIETSTI